MTKKIETYEAMRTQKALEITSGFDDWTGFLNTASRMYKYPFSDQLLIHAQRENIEACASYDVWTKKMGRYVKHGAKGIGLLDYSSAVPRLHYVFAVEDTGERKTSRPFDLWKLTDEKTVSDMLRNEYGTLGLTGLAHQIRQTAQQEAVRVWEERKDEVLGNIDGSFLADYDVDTVGVRFKSAVEASVSYMLMKRCGLEPETILTDEDFMPMLEFNTRETTCVLGEAVSMTAGTMLRQIEAVVRRTEKERRDNHDRTDLQRDGRSVGTRSENGRDEAAGQVRQDETGMAQGEQTPDEQRDDDFRQAVSTPLGDRGDGEREDGRADAEAGEGSGSNREPEGGRSDALGGPDEQLQGTGRRDHSGRIDRQLSFLGENDQLNDQAESTISAFSFAQSDIDEVLRRFHNADHQRMQIVAEYEKQIPLGEIAERLRMIYRGGIGIETENRPISAWAGDEGIRLSAGQSSRYDPHAQIISWKAAAERIGQLLEEGQFAGNIELAEAADFERQQLAERLWHLTSDVSDDTFLSGVREVKEGGFPLAAAKIAQLLSAPEYRERVAQELRDFRTAYEKAPELLRFSYHDLPDISRRLDELALPRREFTSELFELPAVKSFITQDEIDAALSAGSVVAGSKGRIYRFFEDAHQPREKREFLREEYGIGGRSHALSGASGSAMDYSGKGIRLQKKGCADVNLSWEKAANRINELIVHDRFLTKKEEEALRHQEGLELRQRLEASGIVNGEVVDPEKLDADPFIQQVMADAEATQEKAEHEDLPEIHEGMELQIEGRAFVVDHVGMHDVSLRDVTFQEMNGFPIFRSESIEAVRRYMEKEPAETLTEPEPQEEEKPTVKAVNFHIEDDHLGEGGPKAKFADNIKAIRLLKQLETEDRDALPDEQEILSRYVGWGGLADAFDPNKESWANEYKQLKEALTPAEYDAARGSTLNAHYTSPVVIRAIYDAVGNMGFEKGNILEPACGVGNFFGMLPEEMKESRLYGVELDSISGRIAQKLYPKAHIKVAGFETTDRRDFYDLAVGNVPFGNYQVHDKAYDKLGFSIHNYFFAKSLDQVRPGGIVAFVTSRYTMDAKDSTVRRYLAQRADLLGAIRLPNNAFKANAGTEVVSDILFLQKREDARDIMPEWVQTVENEQGHAVNAYFMAHPEMVLGESAETSTAHGMEYTVQPREGKNLSELLKEAVQQVHGSYHAVEVSELSEEADEQAVLPADPDVKNYSFTVVDDQVYFRENSVMVPAELNAAATERVRGMVALRDCVHHLIDLQMDENIQEEAIRAEQEKLNQLYDAFSAKYGLINDKANRQAFSGDSSYYLLCSLEILDEKGKLERKADMFSKRTIKQQKTITHVESAVEALTVSISEKAAVDLPYMAQLTGKTEETLTHDLSGVIFQVPGEENQDGSPHYVSSDEYLSGNVREKLRKAREAQQTDLSFSVNVRALEAAQPNDLDASEIDVRLGATWVDKAYIKQFIFELIKPPFYLQRCVEVNYSPFTAEWNIQGKSVFSSNIANNMTFGTDRASALKIIEDTLNLRDVRIYDTIEDVDGKEKRVLNQKATTLAQQKQQAIKDAFQDWIWKDPQRRQHLVAQYNELFNSERPREYDGSHIAFGDMTPDIVLREHQKNAIAHILYGGNTLLAHEVGAGKTFEMAAAAMESKRLGLCRKSMFVVPNHLTEQWASEFMRLYPSANILVTTKKDFEKANRRKFCARIATGDYDAVIIGHSQFEKIPISAERQERLLRAEIDEITQGIEEMRWQHGERFTVKQLEKTKKSLEARLDKLLAEDKKDDVVTFEQLGVDRLFVDEAHSYKNRAKRCA